MIAIKISKGGDTTDTPISDLIGFICHLPKGEFYRFENGLLQTYQCNEMRGNLYLNDSPVLNYRIESPDKISINFADKSTGHIGYDDFSFNSTDNVDSILKAAPDYPVARQIVTYFHNLLKAKKEKILC